MTAPQFSQPAVRVSPGAFEHAQHYYPRVLNSQIHPTVAHFLALSTERLVARYCHMNPRVDRERLHELFAYEPRFFAWAGSDLFNVATAQGQRQMVIIETNSCPSGQTSMPLRDETAEEGGYALLMERTFLPRARARRLPPGELAVVYDKTTVTAAARFDSGVNLLEAFGLEGGMPTRVSVARKQLAFVLERLGADPNA